MFKTYKHLRTVSFIHFFSFLYYYYYYNHLFRPLFRDHPGETAPEETYTCHLLDFYG